MRARDRNYSTTIPSHQIEFISSGHKPSNTHEWGPGVRDVYALHYIIKGKGTLRTPSGEFKLCKGDSFLIYPYEEIHYFPDLKDPWEYVWIEFRGNDISRIINLTRFSVDHPVAYLASIDFKDHFFIEKSKEKTVYNDIRNDAKLRLLLSYYVEHFPDETVQKSIDYVEQAKEYVQQNYWKDSLSVSNIAAAANVERSYLFRLFKASTGMPISTYLTQFRVRQACLLLNRSDLSIKSVAYSVGYKDPLYFSNVFKKTTSYTPSAYRTSSIDPNEITHISLSLDSK